MMAVYGRNMLIEIKVAVTILCCIVTEIYIDEINEYFMVCKLKQAKPLLQQK
jgi:hypothetical protein